MKLLNDNQLIINKVVNNLGNERFLLQHIKKTPHFISYEEEKDIFNEIMSNTKIISEVKKNIYTKNSVLDDLENVNKLEKDSNEYKLLKDKIINVGEYIND